MGSVSSSSDTKLTKAEVSKVENLSFLSSCGGDEELVHIINVLVQDYKDRYNLE